MLQSIRDRFTGAFAMVLIALLGIGLTITLVDVDTGASRGNFAARVNGEEIPLADFQKVAQQQVLQQEQVTRSELPEAQKLQLQSNVLEGMVRTQVVAQYVNRDGYRVSDDRVVESIRSLPAFQVNGKFSSDGYRATLASQGISTAAFEQERRAALQIEQLQNGLLESAFFTPAEYRRFVLLEGEKRQVRFAVFDPGLVAGDVQPASEEALRSYYEAHPDQFETPETATVEYVELQATGLPELTDPTEAEIRAAYDAAAERFETSAQRRARHILVAVDADTNADAAEKLAAEIKARIDRGEDFATLAKQYSDDPGSAASGGELGWAAKGTYVDAFEAVLFAQKPGEISDPVKTDFGYHIIQLEEIREGSRQPFDEVRADIAAELRAKGAQDRFFELTEKMDEAALQNPGSLDAVSKVAGVPVRRIEAFTRAGGEPLGAVRAVIDAVFSGPVLEDGENSSLIEAGEGRALILRVVEHRPVRLRPIEEVRAELEAAVKADNVARLVAARAEKVAETVRSGGDFAAAVAAEGGKLTAPALPVARNSQDVPAELLAAVYRAPRPDKSRPSVGTVALGNGGAAVFAVDAVIAGSPEEIPAEQRDARKAVLARQSGVAEVTALALDLRRDADVVIAPDLFAEKD